MEKDGKHFHHGKSSRKILNPSRVLTTIGLEEGDVFLDAGAGDGYMSIAASSIVGEKGKVYAIDIYEESINILKEEIENKKISNIEPIVADITAKIPIKDKTVDKCYMANVLHGFVENNEVEKVMKEIRRIVKPRGTFNVIEFKKVQNAPGPPYNVKISPKNVRKIVEEHGFDVETVEEVGEYHYAVIAVRSKY
ncbi:MAG: class I SAM-dependent methyltransferase [Methanobacterium sp.]